MFTYFLGRDVAYKTFSLWMAKIVYASAFIYEVGDVIAPVVDVNIFLNSQKKGF